jgi:hypothetical protein
LIFTTSGRSRTGSTGLLRAGSDGQPGVGRTRAARKRPAPAHDDVGLVRVVQDNRGCRARSFTPPSAPLCGGLPKEQVAEFARDGFYVAFVMGTQSTA